MSWFGLILLAAGLVALFIVWDLVFCGAFLPWRRGQAVPLLWRAPSERPGAADPGPPPAGRKGEGCEQVFHTRRLDGERSGSAR